MDTVTHMIVGATVARATATTHPDENTLPISTRVWIGGAAAAFPDIDYLTVLINPLTFISDWHRAETHSLVMLPLWALLLGYMFAVILKRKQYLRECILICGLSLFSHILTDAITSWGTQIFAPLSDYRLGLGLTFVIDPYFTSLILFGLVAALIRKSRLAAQTGLVVLLAYIGMQGLLKYQAYALGEAHIAEHGWQQASVYTMPQPFSPFHWKIIVSHGEIYHMAHVDLIADESKPMPDKIERTLFDTVYFYRPRQQLFWIQYARYGVGDDNAPVKCVWQLPQLDRFRRFAAYPALHRIDKTATNNCIWFMDLRFVIPRTATPFRYGMCKPKASQQGWQVYRMKRGQPQVVQASS